MATYGSFTPTTTIARAMFNFDAFGISNYKLNGTIRVSVSDAFSFADYLGTSYSNFYSELYTSGSEEIGWTNQMTSNLQEILGIYSQFANLSFSYQGDFDTFTSGSDFTPNPEDIGRFNLSDINITWVYRPDGSFAGISGANTDNPVMGYTGGAGDIFLNSSAVKFAGDFTLDLNTRARQTLMHEIGHSLGLSHPHSGFTSSGTPIITDDYAVTKDLGFGQLGFHIDSKFDMYKEYFTIMSYDDQQSLLPGSSVLFHGHTPMILDVIALQNAYGEGPGTTGTGNDTIEAGNAGYRTYFDKGGIDTINLSTWYTDGAYLHMGATIAGVPHLVGVGMSLLDAQTTITFGGDPQHLRWYYGEYENAIGGPGNDLLIGNVLSNAIFGLGGGDTIRGGAGNDSLNGGDGNDQLFGEDGDDVLDGSWDFDTLDGGPGVDTADYRFFNFNTNANLVTGRVTFPPEWSAGGQFDTLISIENVLTGNANDTITGNGFGNVLDGGGGIDQLTGGSGADTLRGGDGFDYARYDLGTAVIASLASPAANSGDAAGDQFFSIEGLVGSNAGDTLSGNEGVNDILGLGGSDAIDGRGGNDTLRGGAGDDTINGGTGIDRAFFAGPRSAYTLTALSGNGVRVTGPDGNDILSNVEKLVFDDQTTNWPFGSTSPIVRNDFNAGVTSDLLWRHAGGNVTLWDMNGPQMASSSLVAAIPNSWRIIDTGDFSSDTKSDILWRHEGGNVTVWDMNGSQMVGSHLIAAIGNDWQIAGTGDFTGDGKTDILWRHAGGNVTLWEMDGSQMVASYLVAAIGNEWHIADVGDFNDDGKSDILWRHDNGTVTEWEMNGGSMVASNFVAAIPNDWRISGTGDFNGDGRTDILWRHDSGVVTEWNMNGGQMLASNLVAVIPNEWRIVDTGEFNGDGKADILWRHASGVVTEWNMNGGQMLSSHLVATIGNDWQIV